MDLDDIRTLQIEGTVPHDVEVKTPSYTLNVVSEYPGFDALMIASEMSSLTNTVPMEDLPPLEEYFINITKEAD